MQSCLRRSKCGSRRSPGCSFKSQQTKAKNLKEAYAKAKANRDEIKTKINPLEKSKKTHERKSRQLEEAMKDKQTGEKRAKGRAKKLRDKLEKLRGDATEKEGFSLRSCKSSAITQGILNGREVNLEALERDRLAMGDEESIVADLGEWKKRFKEAERALNALKQQCRNLKEKQRQLAREKSRKDKQRAQLTDRENQRVRAVRDAPGGDEAHRAYEWIKSAERMECYKAEYVVLSCSR